MGPKSTAKLLSDPIIGPSIAPPTSRMRAFVSLGSLVTFVGKLSDQSKQDVLDSVAICQLSADKKHDRKEEPIPWLKTFTSAIGKVGWTTNTDSRDTPLIDQETFAIYELTLESIHAVANKAEFASIVETLDALHSFRADDPRLVLLDNCCVSPTGALLLVVVAREDSNAATSVLLESYCIVSDTSGSNLLWFRYQSSRCKVFQTSSSHTLSEDVFSNVRGLIRDKLKGLDGSGIIDVGI